jgi:hypothetical protein
MVDRRECARDVNAVGIAQRLLHHPSGRICAKLDAPKDKCTQVFGTIGRTDEELTEENSRRHDSRTCLEAMDRHH